MSIENKGGLNKQMTSENFFIIKSPNRENGDRENEEENKLLGIQAFNKRVRVLQESLKTFMEKKQQEKL